jgi:hypothetical protein
MAMTNAERQAEWRARQKAELAKLRRREKASAQPETAKRPSKRERQGQPPPPPKPFTKRQVAKLIGAPELEAILTELEYQGAQHRAAYSPSAVLQCAHRIRKLITAIAQDADS